MKRIHLIFLGIIILQDAVDGLYEQSELWSGLNVFIVKVTVSLKLIQLIVKIHDHGIIESWNYKIIESWNHRIMEL